MTESEEAAKESLIDDLIKGILSATLIEAHKQDIRALAAFLARAGWRKP